MSSKTRTSKLAVSLVSTAEEAVGVKGFCSIVSLEEVHSSRTGGPGLSGLHLIWSGSPHVLGFQEVMVTVQEQPGQVRHENREGDMLSDSVEL